MYVRPTILAWISLVAVRPFEASFMALTLHKASALRGSSEVIKPLFTLFCILLRGEDAAKLVIFCELTKEKTGKFIMDV